MASQAGPAPETLAYENTAGSVALVDKASVASLYLSGLITRGC